jgi:thiol-disulfide isomerase/thioredoxin
MKKFIKLALFSFLLILLPHMVNAASFEYKDKVYDIVGETESSKVTVYLFYSSSCIHCKAENAFLDELQGEYGKIVNFKRYEVTQNTTNSEYMEKAKDRMESNSTGVPFTVIGDKYYVGYSDTIGKTMKNTIDSYIKSVNGNTGNNTDDGNKDDTVKENNNTINLPLLGDVNAKQVSLPLVAVILGTIDGFNPCAMWVLLFLINMLFTMKDRKKMWLLGITFLFTSAFVYFLAMLGLSVVIGMTAVVWVRTVIALVAIIGGIVNLNTYLKTPKDGCHVVDEKKRKKYFTRMKKFTLEQNIVLALIGVIALAASVNLVELACSAGFPTIFISMLDLNGLNGFESILYILLYIVFFLIDDIIVFVIAMTTLKVAGVTTKYNRLSHLIGGIIMVVIGLLLILKPEWIMLNF